MCGLALQALADGGGGVRFGPVCGQVQPGSPDPGNKRPDDFRPSDLPLRLGADVQT